MEKAFIIRNNRAIGMDVQRIYTSTPIGVIQPFASDENIPNGYLLCDGASYKVADYPHLYAVIGNTYGGDTENFNVPNLVDKFIQGSTTSGTEKEAGLPNIEGSVEYLKSVANKDLTNEWNGAFKWTTYSATSNIPSQTNSANSYDLEFDASKSNEIYGNSDTVQPPALTMVYIIKAFHTNEGVDSGVSDDVVNYVEGELATKLDKEYITGITDANNAIGENGVNIFVMSASSSNMPLSRTGIIRSYTTIEDKYIRVNQEYSTIDNAPQIGGTYKRYGASDDGGATFTWSNWNFVGSIDDTTTASLKTWSSSKIASEISNATAIKYDNVINPNATKETGLSLAQGESHFYGRLLQLDGHLGSKSSTFSFLLFVKANYDNPTTVYATQLAGMDDDRSNIAHTTYFELGVSSSGNLTIKNKSAVTASYRFI